MANYDIDHAVRQWETFRKSGDLRRAGQIARQIVAHGYRHPSDILYSRHLAGKR